jgi:hypothetical protein
MVLAQHEDAVALSETQDGLWIGPFQPREVFQYALA